MIAKIMPFHLAEALGRVVDGKTWEIPLGSFWGIRGRAWHLGDLGKARWWKWGLKGREQRWLRTPFPSHIDFVIWSPLDAGLASLLSQSRFRRGW